MLRPRLLIMSAALALVPSIAWAQGGGAAPAGRTHTVRAGDTLWDIAMTYFGDPFLWPEIYRVNTDVIEDPHWIFPGEVLRIPDIAALQQRTPDEIAVRPAPPPVVVDTVTPRAQTPNFGARYMRAPHTAVRANEYLVAPYAAPAGGPPGAGRIFGHAEPGRRPSDDKQRGILPEELLIVEQPNSVRAVRGDRFMVVRLGGMLPRNAQVVIPIGIVEVEDDANESGGRVLARLHLQFSDVHIGDRLVPVDTLVARVDVVPASVTPSLLATVTWVSSQPILPSIGSYLMFNAAALDGVVTGDQITLFRERGTDRAGVPLTAEVLGVAQILRVTEYGASAIIIQHPAPGIGVGTKGWLTGKMQ